MTGRNNRMVWVAGIALVIGAVCHAEVEYTAKRYDVILERSPFGVNPSAVSTPDASAQQQAAVAALEKTCRLSFLLMAETGEAQAGFQLKSAKPGDPSSYIVRIGESFMGMKLESVDMENSEATLQHNGKQVVFQLSKQPEETKQAKKQVGPRVPKPRRGFRNRTKPSPPPAAPAPRLSPEEQKARREEIREHLQEYQMKVIREGLPPLPIPLTKEMDDQLVSEGVLPSLEGEAE